MPAGVPDQHWVERTEANASMAVRDVMVMIIIINIAHFMFLAALSFKRRSHSFLCLCAHFLPLVLVLVTSADIA
jgi:hypothetical protein